MREIVFLWKLRVTVNYASEHLEKGVASAIYEGKKRSK